MRQDTERVRRVPPLLTGQAAPERHGGVIDSDRVIVAFHLEIPVERRPISIREADADKIHRETFL
jgi:hypothetical protein